MIPPAGLDARYRGEWTGLWENAGVESVVPWVDAHLPVIRNRAGRILAGLSAGGYGAVDIGLRHPLLFWRTLESWSGDFGAPHDGWATGCGSRRGGNHGRLWRAQLPAALR